MNDTADKLEVLEKLVSLNQSQTVQHRLDILEEQINRISSIVVNLKATVQQLQMDFHRDHVTLADSQKY